MGSPEKTFSCRDILLVMMGLDVWGFETGED